MPNCDWGKPCDCIDCRTNTFSIPCESCGFETTVSYVMSQSPGSTDRKGIFGYNFHERTDNSSEIDCFNCGHHNVNVPYYEKVEVAVNNQKKNLKVCTDCGIKEFDTWRYVHFKEWKNQTFCLGCLEKRFSAEIPNPSTNDNTYKLDIDSMKYVLDKVKVQCVSCGRKRWLKAENSWKKKCMNCYKKAL